MVVTHSYVGINKIMDHSVFQETLVSHEQRLRATSFFQTVINMFPNELVEAFVDIHRSARNGVTKQFSSFNLDCGRVPRFFR